MRRAIMIVVPQLYAGLIWYVFYRILGPQTPQGHWWILVTAVLLSIPLGVLLAIVLSVDEVLRKSSHLTFRITCAVTSCAERSEPIPLSGVRFILWLDVPFFYMEFS